MPVELCRAACSRLGDRFTTTPRFLEHQLASDLLVSREAIRWRLRSLGLMPAPGIDPSEVRAVARAGHLRV